MTPALIELMPKLQYFLVENERTSRRFISSLKLGIDIASLHFDVLDKHTPEDRAAQLCAPLLQGTSMGVMSEAGCPGVADPGNLAVRYAHAHSIRVVPIAGPSSFLMALMASGMNGQSFAFHGYLPIDKQKRIKSIKALEKTALQTGQTQIFMETPYRNNKLVADILKSCAPSTLLCIARDVTGPEEMIVTMPVSNWKRNIPELHKVPTVFLIHGN